MERQVQGEIVTGGIGSGPSVSYTNLEGDLKERFLYAPSNCPLPEGKKVRVFLSVLDGAFINMMTSACSSCLAKEEKGCDASRLA